MFNKFKKIFYQPITYILLFAFLLRLVMIPYGLPLWIYNDEPPFVLAALKMMQLKTVLPVLHEADFKPFLYYPPYISYLYLPFFLITTLISYFSFGENFSEFQAHIASDPSAFFLTGRLVILMISLITIFLIYKITGRLVKNMYASIGTAIFSSTSIMFISLSITSKHWMPILFFFTLGLFILTNEKWSFKKRLLLSAVTTGIGTGVSTIVILFSIIMVLWYLFFEKKNIKNLITNPSMYLSALIIVVLAIIPVLLYPASLGFAPDMTLHDPKTFLGFLTSPFVFTSTFLFTEPIIAILSILGLILGFRKYKQFFITSIIFGTVYSITFYTFFRFEYRFLLPLILLLIIGAGFGIKELSERLPKKVFLTFFSILIILTSVFSIRLSILGSRNDSRIQSKNWLENNIPEDEKVIVYANLMRLPNSVSGIKEQEFIDANSLRTVDKNELSQDQKLRKEKIFHALNLYTVQNNNFYDKIVPYAKKQSYKYLVLSKQDFLNKPEQFEDVKKLTENATLVASFGNDIGSYSLSKTEIGPTLLPLFQIHEFGPTVEIYKLNLK